MSKRRNHSEVVFIRAGAGFGPGNAFGQIQPEPEYRVNRTSLYNGRQPATERFIAENDPCPLDCGDPNCREWNDVRLLPGASRAEAIQALVKGDYAGYANHVSECEMTDDFQQL